jgi:hypothetical protein
MFLFPTDTISRRAAKAYAATVAAAPRTERRTLLGFHGDPDRGPLDAIEAASAPLLTTHYENLRRAADAIAAEPDAARRRKLALEIDSALWDLVLGYAERSYDFGVELGRHLNRRAGATR